ncbi:cobalamin binding intrinsic factor-like [Patagioenas fasciata]|uniref:cobalamin binding intrinsic factor-like n=1 Tax=Patagioenas fasciata TaxID=372321 RepID=UPI0032E8D40A
MLNVAFGIGVLLALAGGMAVQGCVAPQQLVSELAQRMDDLIKAEGTPNPSVLLALNLAGATGSNTRKWLLQEVEEEAVTRAQRDMTSGEVALSVLSLLSSCRDPRNVQALGLTVDLVQVLQQKMDEEMAMLEEEGIPKTTLYSVSLSALALCLTGAGGYQGASVILAKQVLSPDSHLSVDTCAMAALAMTCTYGQTDLQDLQELLWEALSAVANSFLDEQEEGDGVIGNIYSTGLAMQALVATGEFYAPRVWDCTQALAAVSRHDYSLPMAIAQVLPALVGRSYLDTADLDCTTRMSPNLQSTLSPKLQPSPSPKLQPSLSPKLGTAAVHRAATITVHYSISNTLQGRYFSYTTAVQVPDGSVLLQVLQAAQEKEPDIFSFQTEQTSWGPMVISIHGLAADQNRKTYWQFLSSGVALEEGVGTYKPQDEEHIQAVFSTY